MVLVIIGFVVCSVSHATALDVKSEDVAESVQTSESVPVLDPVVVVGNIQSSASGETTIHSDKLSEIPSRNGSLNEAITVAPGVQYSDVANSSSTAGEILPPSLSISGGRIYQNNFLIDGFSNNSLLDPVETDTSSATKISGHPQELFVNARLVDNVTIYDSNVPAEYGSFTGGVVDAELIRPGETFNGSFFYRTTRDELTSFHIDPDDLFDFENSTSATNGQPNFQKHDFGTILNLPISDNSGLILSYQQLYSQIPLQHFGIEENQSRRTENFYVKYGGNPGSGSYAELSLLYTPYSAKYFRNNTMNSDYTVHGGGLLIGTRGEKQFKSVLWDAQVGYKRSKNYREAPTNFFGWAPTASKPWGGTSNSYEGMLGDLESTQESLQVKSDLSFTTFKTGGLSHSFKAGFDYEYIRATYDRPETTWQFYRYSDDYFPGPTPDPTDDLVPESLVVCAPGDIACIDGEQYFNRRFVYEAAVGVAKMSLGSIYLQDTSDLWRLQLRLGARVSYDDFMGNLNVAPRLSANYDLFGNGRTRLIGGWNRYFGKSVLTYKLHEAISPSSMQDMRSLLTLTPEPWVSSSEGARIYRYSELDTPYKDEITFGLEQLLFRGLLHFRYINRKGEDEFAREYVRKTVSGEQFNYYIMTNAGRSTYEAYLLSWERVWRKHYLNVNGTFQTTTTGNENYGDLILDSQLERQYWYEGELYFWDERPREDFSRPWVVNLTYTVQVGKWIQFTNFTKYRSDYYALKLSRPVAPEVVYDAERVRQPSTMVFDWMLSWTIPSFKTGQQFILTAELYNVFNKKTHLGEEENLYELGRQFWAGVEYRF